jgi:hypothetical protein
VRTEREKGVALITSLLVLILVSAIVVGMSWMVMTDQRLGGNSQSREIAFYGAEAGMEQLTSDVSNTFSVKGALTPADIATITSTPPNQIPGVQYMNASGASTYNITFTPDPVTGLPESTYATILPPSPYAGMQGLITPFTLNVAAQNIATGSEVKLLRELQVVAIPVFQFGVYSDSDLAFFAGPPFEFGGRTHTNGNLWLAANAGPLYLGDKVTAVGQVIRTNLENGFPISGANYTGDVSIALTPNPATLPPSPSYSNGQWLALGLNQGSVLGTSAYGTGNVSTIPNGTNYSTWNTIEGTYNGQLKNFVPILSLTATALGGITTPISLIRRAIPGEATTNPAEFSQQYFSQATLRILLDDYPAGALPGTAGACHGADMMSLGGDYVTTGSDPIDLATLAFPWTAGGVTVAGPPAWYSAGALANNAPAYAYPLPVSGSTGAYSATDGYWLATHYPVIRGCIKIEYQSTTANSWTDITTQILSQGFTGRDINPVGNPANMAYPGGVTINYVNPTNPTTLPSLATITTKGVQVPAQGPSPAGTVTSQTGCADLSPKAIIRLARVRDNPNWDPAGGCTTTGITGTATFSGTDFWPMVLYDAREGVFRATSTLTVLRAQGMMYYIELDAANLATWLKSNQGGLGLNNNSGFTVYFSDRRGEQPDATLPVPSKTGSYGYNDFVNANDVANGCPNRVIDFVGQGEDLEGDGLLRTYGGSEMAPAPMPPTYAVSLVLPGLWNGTNMVGVLNQNSTAGCGGYPNRPDVEYANPQEARENPAVFFRRALKIVNGATLNLGTSCYGAAPSPPCGLTIVSENPVYIQGDYNAPVDNGTWTGASVAAAVAGDAVTFLSNNWNDVNSFAFPYNINDRQAVPTAYRAAIISGKGIPFTTLDGVGGLAQDFGTDGGVHNFLRFIENWGVVCHYRGSLVSFYYNRQAVGTYKGTGVYNPPSPRDYTFDTNFTLGPSYLPPQTPKLKSVNTTGFSQEILPTQ